MSWGIPEGAGELTSLNLEDPKSPRTYFTQPLNPLEIADLEELYSEFPIDHQLDRIIEDPDEGRERKVKLLEHLVARFAESFTDYALQVYAMSANEDEANRRLISDKLALLQDYPAASVNRAKGYKYNHPDEAESISGFKRRVYRLPRHGSAR